MWHNPSSSVRTVWVLITLAVTAGFPLAAAAENVPPSIAALLPPEVKLGDSNWAVFETEFGKTFGGGMQASSFPGQHPSCPFAGTPELKIELKGDTAFENPPMLDMMISDYETGVANAPAVLSKFMADYITTSPDVVSVGTVQEETRPDGYLVYMEYKENCSNHPNGSKTRLTGLARRGATQLSFQLVVAVDGTAAVALAADMLQNFAKLDIAALTQ